MRTQKDSEEQHFRERHSLRSLTDCRHSAPLASGANEGPIRTGRIDFEPTYIPARYKQSRAGVLKLDIKCAWFNEAEYCEFFPRTLFPHRRRLSSGAISGVR
jgi:hypothetical protein